MAMSKACARAAFGTAAHTEVNAKVARFELLQGHTRNKERNRIGADITLRHGALHQVSDVIAVGDAGACSTSRKAEIRRKAVDFEVRDAAGSEGDVGVEQEISTVRLQAVARIGGKGNHYATRTLG